MESIAQAVNTLSRFLAHEQIHSATGVAHFLDGLPANQGPDVIVLCGSAILSLGDDVFSLVSSSDFCNDRNIALVICGGIGHSTTFMYDAVRQHPRYHILGDEIQGLPESRIFEMIAQRWYGLSSESEGSPFIFIEDRSTNCGANAQETKRTLDAQGLISPRSIVVVQDPTMSRRTTASFEHSYADIGVSGPKIIAWPTFVPVVEATSGSEGGLDAADGLQYSSQGPTGERKNGLWDMRRFLDLLIGEIPRMRDDERGYGPRGKGFIPHVDIPADVEEAWGVLSSAMKVIDRPA
ncbi:hypothetical protein B0T11DRAFT_275273 [Plectosphaerella cucumerina]|uniref:DUF218 domain-containing protein n=1 Tax=Plectosphaerella cucumerina TaxID=40658 RepID=A0A8K0TJ98_9PEZI|nr:hypothetical protein B0T11DRAFT_275273 [Plectosphaerella cucumerina]